MDKLQKIALTIFSVYIIGFLLNTDMFLNPEVRANREYYEEVLSKYQNAENALHMANESYSSANAELHKSLDERHTAFCDLALVKTEIGDTLLTPLSDVRKICVSDKYLPIFHGFNRDDSPKMWPPLKNEGVQKGLNLSPIIALST